LEKKNGAKKRGAFGALTFKENCDEREPKKKTTRRGKKKEEPEERPKKANRKLRDGKLPKGERRSRRM